MQTKVIKGKIVEQYGSIGKFAEELNWSATKISRLLNGKQDPNVKDVKEIALALGIANPVDIVALFLCD